MESRRSVVQIAALVVPAAIDRIYSTVRRCGLARVYYTRSREGTRRADTKAEDARRSAARASSCGNDTVIKRFCRLARRERERPPVIALWTRARTRFRDTLFRVINKRKIKL